MQLPAPLDRLVRRLARAWEDRAVTLKAASFAGVGVVNSLVDLAIFLAAYNLLGLPLVPANVLANTTTLVVASYWVPVLAAKLLAIVVSFAVNFSLSHFVVFRARTGEAERSAK
jgi:putative flippase GtrA